MRYHKNEVIIKDSKRGARGSALLIVLLLITVLATIALGVGQLTLAEVKMQTGMEDAAIAYHAAEAGIEDGLLRWRYDRNVETPANHSANPPVIPSEDTKDVIRVDVSENDTTSPNKAFIGKVNPADTGVVEPTHSYYDLKIWYRDDVVGNYDNFTTPGGDEKRLAADEALELTAPNDLNFTFSLKFVFDGTAADHLLSIRAFDSAGASVNVAECGGICTANRINGINLTVSQRGKIIIKPWRNGVRYAMKAKEPAGRNLLDTGTTYIESIGYFGSAKRKLVAKIDRKSGTLLGIYDFVLYSGTGSIRQ